MTQTGWAAIHKKERTTPNTLETSTSGDPRFLQQSSAISLRNRTSQSSIVCDFTEDQDVTVFGLYIGAGL